MKDHIRLSSRISAACAVLGAASIATSICSAQTFTAADYATNAAYSDGWQETDNGGFGFTPWSFAGTTGSTNQHRMDNSSPFNPLGLAWTLFNEVTGPSDLANAGRGFVALQVGQTLSTVFSNPTNRVFYHGYTIKLVSGGKNTQVGGVERFAFYMFDYYPFDTNVGVWKSDGAPGGYTTLYDTNTSAAGTRFDFTLTGANYYKATMTPLAHPEIAYTQAGPLANTGPIDWLQFEFYNSSPSDPTNSATDFYVSKITVTDVQPISPSIVAEPTSRVLYPGRTARFTAAAVGTSLSYQWRKNGTNLTNGGNASGALSDTLVISNVGASDVAAYTLVVSNSITTVTSTPAANLTLAQPSGTPYENAVLAANPIAHWRLNEVANPATNPPAYDYAGGLAGTYGSVATNGFYSIAGPRPPDWPGFENNNYALESTADTDQSWVTVPALNLNTNAVTIVLWLNPNGTQNDATPGVFVTRQGSTKAAGVSYQISDQIAYNWNDDPATYNFTSGLSPAFNQWSFVALVVEPTQATLYLYTTNSQSSAVNAVTHANVIWDGTARIGSDENNLSRTFDGLIDEVAVFNYSFTPDQVLALFNAALSVNVSIQQVGTKIVLSWPTGTLLEATNVTGPWVTNNATSPYTNTPTGLRKFYRVIH